MPFTIYNWSNQCFMVNKNSLTYLLFVLTSLFVLSACSQDNSAELEKLSSQMATVVVLSIENKNNDAAKAAVKPLPTYTPVPTLEPLPTYTPLPTCATCYIYPRTNIYSFVYFRTSSNIYASTDLGGFTDLCSVTNLCSFTNIYSDSNCGTNNYYRNAHPFSNPNSYPNSFRL